MLCNKCGHDLGSSPFCTHCGTPATQAQQRQQMIEQPTPAPTDYSQVWQQPLEITKKDDKSKKGIIITIIIILIFIAAAVAVIYFAVSNNSEDDDSSEDDYSFSEIVDNDKDDDSNKNDDDDSEELNSDIEPTVEECALQLLEDYNYSIINCDGELYTSITLEMVVRRTIEHQGSVEAALESQSNFFKDIYGDNPELTFSIDYCTKLDEYEIDEFNNDLADKYGARALIDEAYIIDYTKTFGEGTEGYSTARATILLVEDKWYIYI